MYAMMHETIGNRLRFRNGQEPVDQLIHTRLDHPAKPWKRFRGSVNLVFDIPLLALLKCSFPPDRYSEALCSKIVENERQLFNKS